MEVYSNNVTRTCCKRNYIMAKTLKRTKIPKAKMGKHKKTYKTNNGAICSHISHERIHDNG